MLKADFFSAFLKKHTDLEICQKSATFPEDISYCDFDSRRLKPGSLFAAFKGEQNDGHDFLELAWRNGAHTLLLEKQTFEALKKTEKLKFLEKAQNVTVVLCKNVEKIWQDLAKEFRATWEFPVVAVAGSNGKTTTTQFCLQVAQYFSKAAGTYKNFNNHLGLPFSILNSDPNSQIGIFEVGMNHPGEVAELCEILRPNLGGLTSIGEEHLEFFKNLEEVAAAEFELFDFLKSKKSIFIINQNDSFIYRWFQENQNFNQLNSYWSYKLIQSRPESLDLGQKNLLLIEVIKQEHNSIQAVIYWGGQKLNYSFPLGGLYNLSNFAFALTVQLSLGKDIFTLLNTANFALKLPALRQEYYTFEGNEYLLDCYNSNPSSLKLSVDNFIALAASKGKAIIAGDMFELGKFSQEKHREALLNLKNLLESNKIQMLFLIGKSFHSVWQEFQLKHPKDQINSQFHVYENLLDLKNYIQENSIQDILFLVKGSRGMKLEKIVNKIYS